MIPSISRPSKRLAAGAFTACALLAGCGGGDGPARLPTLDGNQPLILSHRGLPGVANAAPPAAFRLTAAIPCPWTRRSQGAPLNSPRQRPGV